MSKNHVDQPPENKPADENQPLNPEQIKQIQDAVRDEAVEVPAGADDLVEAFRATLAERDDWHDRFVRLGADYQNFQRRAANNERQARQSATAGVVQSLLPVMDNFDLALEQSTDAATIDQIMGGVHMIRDELQRILGSFGVTPVDPAPGDAFNPSEHEAMLQQPSEDIEPGRIVQSLARGYRLGERVIRPAKVIIARSPDEGQE